MLKHKDDIKAVMVEYTNDSGEWAWYAVVRDATPRQALKWYAKEHGIEGEAIAEERDGLYLGGDKARAYVIDVISIKK